MNISIFNRDYPVRRYGGDGNTYSEFTANLHLHEVEQDAGAPWNETKGIVRRLDGHGMTELHVADMEAGTKGDRVLYNGRWYECTASVLYSHTILGHWNYHFIVVPEDAVDVITLLNAAYDQESGLDTFIATVIRGVSWIYDEQTTADNVGLKASGTCTIRIPEDADFEGKVYVAPKAYTGASGTFTLKPGDIIVRAEETEITSPGALKDKYDETVTVIGITDNREAPNARHWKVTAQ